MFGYRNDKRVKRKSHILTDNDCNQLRTCSWLGEAKIFLLVHCAGNLRYTCD